jgi:hypothetical protein
MCIYIYILSIQLAQYYINIKIIINYLIIQTNDKIKFELSDLLITIEYKHR